MATSAQVASPDLINAIREFIAGNTKDSKTEDLELAVR